MRPKGRSASAELGQRGVGLGHAVLILGVAACGAERPVDLKRLAALEAPAEHQSGEAFFNASCAACHGANAAGTDHGPPLVHAYYRPAHHGDAAFQFAATLGVKAHHWRFGDMPPVSGVSVQDVAQITAYVRWLQKQVGIQ